MKIWQRAGERLNDDPERGSVSTWVAITALAMMLFVGIAVDFNGQVHTLQRARDVAAQAARAGGQEIVGSRAMRGHGVSADPVAARNAAQDYLAAAGVRGTVNVVNGTRLVVTVNDRYDTKILSIVGVGSLPATGEAEARLTRVMGGVEQ
ncbi:pilus assembly protein TadG-related protein [Isoptericola sp. NPDC056578]|uniref:pilus assembly protein TadG-related protein n=1 Tax=unclassified Isoptericola TaxID=2623355 RepID=UPI0036BD630E